MTTKPGKQGTKGQKQILQENTETLNFYRYMMLGAAGIYFIVGMIFFAEFPTLDLVLMGFAGVVWFACFRFMSSMATPKLAADGSILDEGCDLNMEGGLAEHVKDLIILTSAVVIFSTYSTYFWLLWLLAPIRGFQMAWTNFIGPWIFQEAPEESKEEMLDKKQQKLRRRMKYRA